MATIWSAYKPKETERQTSNIEELNVFVDTPDGDANDNFLDALKKELDASPDDIQDGQADNWTTEAAPS